MATVSDNTLGDDDFFSRYISHSTGSDYLHGQASELSFSPSPAKPKQHKKPDNNIIQPSIDGVLNGRTASDTTFTVPSSQSDVPFCTEDNLQQCVQYINQEVTTLGLPSLYDKGMVSTVKLINCCYELLQKYQRHARHREDMEDRLHRTTSDLEAQHSNGLRLRQSLELQERDTASAEERERQMKHKNNLLNAKLKTEKEEVKRLLSVIQHRDAQYKHELKKKEREQSTLKERLHSLLTNKTDRRIGIVIANNLTRVGGKRGKWATNTRGEEELYRGVISTYEEKQKQLMVENNELRQSLTHLQKELVTMLKAPHKQGTRISISLSDDEEEEEKENSGVNGSTTGQLSEGMFQMPYDMVRDTIEENLREHCVKLRQYIQQILKQQKSEKTENGAVASNGANSRRESTTKKVPTEEEERWKQEVQHLRDIIEQQEELLQEKFDAVDSEHGGDHGLNESALWEDKQLLERERDLFKQQQENFYRERSTFTEAAIRLAKERQALEEEKAMMLSQQFNSLTPFRAEVGGGGGQGGAGNRSRRPVSASATPSCTPLLRSHHKRSRQLPSTPKAAAPVASLQQQHKRPFSTPVSTGAGKVLTPSTAELYRSLGLQHLSETPQSAHVRRGSSDYYKDEDEDEEMKRRAEHIDGVRLTLFMNQAAAAAANEN